MALPWKHLVSLALPSNLVFREDVQYYHYNNIGRSTHRSLSWWLSKQLVISVTVLLMVALKTLQGATRSLIICSYQDNIISQIDGQMICILHQDV